jgi:hypothetical protein
MADANTYLALAQLATSYFNSQNLRAVDRANDRAAEAVYSSRRRVRDAARTAAAGRADLERFKQSLNNQATRAAAEQSGAALRANINAQRDYLTARTFEGRLAGAQRAGEVQAQAAAAGVTGGSTALVVGTQQLALARQTYADKLAQERRDSGAAIQSAAVSASSIAGLDQRTVFAAFDRTVEAPPVRTAQGSGWTDLITAISSVGVKRLANAAEDAYGEIRGLFKDDPYGPSYPDQTPNETARLARQNEEGP